jgi:RHS repeat-associated protein
VAKVVDAGKSVVQSYSYDSYGLPQATTGFRNAFTFTGREWDGDIGLLYYRLRYYDPVEGIFISRDPIGIASGTANLYGYVGGNPGNYTDPSGLAGTLATTLWSWGGAGTRVVAGGATATVGLTGGIVTGIIFGMPTSMAGGEYDHLVFRANPNTKGSTPITKSPKVIQSNVPIKDLRLMILTNYIGQ